MLAWLPSVISLIIGILGQFNTADLVAAHPNVAMGLGTLGMLITALTKSPLTGASSPSQKFLVIPFLVGCLLSGFAAPALAVNVTVQGAQVELSYEEPSTNADGSALLDLAKTISYFSKLPDGQPQRCIESPASAPTGGGVIRAVCLVPVAHGQEVDVRFTVTAMDTSGNESGPSDPVDKRIDFLAPSAPR